MEIWKDVIGYEGLYQVSNIGRVKANYKHNPPRILKGYINKNGYKLVTLYKNKTRWGTGVHRLVAQAFIPNPHNLPQVNHKDENKLNNNVDNLEWCTPSYNTNYGSRNDVVSEALTNHPLKCKVVVQYDLGMNFIKEYPSTRECERQGYIQSSISMCCLGKQLTHKGYIWKYKEDLKDGELI